ncbi:MAG: PEGA domain-containing protein [Myxococcales bacterium]|nr:PEGA domain-containing protein [Myxococcales bacterium]
MIRRTLLILPLVIVAWTSSARAGGDVGVVVTGDTTMQPQVLALVEGWLRAHGHQLVASPLPPESTNKLIDCFVMEDTGCARKLIEAQAKTSTVVFARVEVADNAGGMRDVTMTAYWFERGSDPVAEKRSCEKCTDGTLRTTNDALMSALAGSGRKTVGQLVLSSTPAGAHVTIDGAASGVTPLEIALAPGAHQVIVSADGRADATRSVTIVQGESTPLAISLHAPGAGSRHGKLPAVAIGVGGALLLTGVILYATSETDTGEKFEYRDTRALGIGVAVSGLAVASVGAYLWFTGKRSTDSAPAVAVVPGGAYVGWGRSF